VNQNYNSYCGGSPTVNGTYYDDAGSEIDGPVVGGSGVFYITATELRSDSCASSITVVPVDSSATIAVDLAKDVQLSSPPLGGKYKIECTDSEGYVSETVELNSHSGAWTFGYYVQNQCDGLFDKIRVHDISSATFGKGNKNGRAFIIDYQGLNADPGQMRLISGTDTPLSGDNLVYTANTTSAYSTNIYYDAIPFEMLRTYESEP